jgi:hypothetical protein
LIIENPLFARELVGFTEEDEFKQLQRPGYSSNRLLGGFKLYPPRSPGIYLGSPGIFLALINSWVPAMDNHGLLPNPTLVQDGKGFLGQLSIDLIRIAL